MIEINAPSVPPIPPHHVADGAREDLVRGEYHEGLRFADLDLSGADVSGATFEGCEFSGVDADGLTLTGARLLETTWSKVTAPSWRCPRTGWRDVEVSGSRIGAWELHDAEARSVRISRSRLSWVNLRAAKLTDVVVEDCVIDELDLSQATATRLAFSNCTVQMLRCDRARFTDVDLRGLDFAGVGGLDGLRGATMSPFQAQMLNEVFLDHFGIRVDG